MRLVLLVLVVVLVVVPCAPPSSAEVHAVINVDFTRGRGDTAWLDVTSEPGEPVTFTVLPPAFQETVQPNDRNFVTSSDLFAASDRMTALVFAQTAAPGTRSTAVLRQHLRNKRLSMVVPPLRDVQGQSFAFPLGASGTSATLFIANPSADPAEVVVLFGSVQTPPVATFLIDRNQVARFTLTESSTRVIVVVANQVNVIVQLAVDSPGADFDLFFIPPIR